MTLAPAFPAVAADAVLDGFRVLGLDADAIRRGAGLEGDLAEPGRMLPDALWRALWRLGRGQAARETLALEVGLALPFGSFGMVDYLAGSAPTVGEALDALARHFRLVAMGFHLELTGDDAHPRVTIIDTGGGSDDDDELTLGVLLGRFRDLAAGPGVRAAEVTLRRAVRAPAPFEALVGAPVRAGAGAASITFRPPGRAVRLTSADAALHRTMTGLAARIGLGGDGANDLELAIRSRLRLALPERELDVGPVARGLGLSVRTLHRRLGEAGRTWRAVVDDFRALEAERLLTGGATATEAAHALGYRDTSSFSRAFRRWRGVSPTAWRRSAPHGSRSS